MLWDVEKMNGVGGGWVVRRINTYAKRFFGRVLFRVNMRAKHTHTHAQTDLRAHIESAPRVRLYVCVHYAYANIIDARRPQLYADLSQMFTCKTIVVIRKMGFLNLFTVNVMVTLNKL